MQEIRTHFNQFAYKNGDLNGGKEICEYRYPPLARSKHAQFSETDAVLPAARPVLGPLPIVGGVVYMIGRIHSIARRSHLVGAIGMLS